MNNWLNISTFLIGFSTAFFTVFSAHILFWRKEKTRFQKVLGCIMLVWALFNFKDIIVTFPDMYNQQVLNWILIIDGWSAITYTIFVQEVTQPGWTTWRRLLLQMLPFFVFTLSYGVSCSQWTYGASCSQWIINAYIVFLWCYAWTVVIVGYIKIKRYLNYIRRNFSNIDNLDVSWMKPVFVFAVISQLAWLCTSMYATIVADIIYYIFVLLLWLIVLHYSWNFRPISIPANTSSTSPKAPHISLSEADFQNIIVGRELYLNKELTLSDLARTLHTNRTYLSQYLSTVCGLTFYDLINKLRIEKKSVPLMREHPEYTLEYIALQSGFGSISSFRRAFQKFMGMSPSEFTAHNA